MMMYVFCEGCGIPVRPHETACVRCRPAIEAERRREKIESAMPPTTPHRKERDPGR